VLLLVADRRSRKTPDQAHPLGYGREAYVWSLFAALGLFTVGAVVSVWHGVTSLRAPEESTSFVWAYAVLAIAFVLEGTSFLRALRQTGVEAQGLDRDLLEHALTTSDPTLRAVLAEDAAALVGLVVAFAGVLAHQLTANPMWDALGSILVGLVLGAVAVVLIQRNTSFLTGRAGDDRLRDAAVARLREVPQIERVTYLRLEFVGPRQLVLLARVDLRGDLPESEVAATVRDVERELERRPTVVEALISLATSDEPSI
jgi:cation diffusion facilitator family transporter